MRKAVFAVLTAVLVSGLAGCGGEDPKPAADDGNDHTRSAPLSEESSSPVEAPPATDETVVELEVAGGKRSSGPEGVEVAKGDKIEFVITADAPDELHLHGYDKTATIGPGKPARLAFTADLPGVWELELHESGALLTTLTVTE